MKMKTTGMLATVSLCALAGVAQGQKTLHLDVNSLDYDFGTFGGEFHDDGLIWTDDATTSIGAAIGYEGPGGSFDPVDLGAGITLADFTGNLEFDSGVVDSGSFTITLSNGDTYNATIIKGSGKITPLGGDDYVIKGMTYEGTFNDDVFGAIDVSEWTAKQGEPGQLFGEFLEFFFDATQSDSGNLEVYVTVPLPPTAYAGLGMLAGVMGLSYVLRRR